MTNSDENHSGEMRCAPSGHFKSTDERKKEVSQAGSSRPSWTHSLARLGRAGDGYAYGVGLVDGTQSYSMNTVLTVNCIFRTAARFSFIRHTLITATCDSHADRRHPHDTQSGLRTIHAMAAVCVAFMC